MNISRKFGLCLVMGALGLSMTARAEDIDIYSDAPRETVPNVLIVIDNAANFEAAADSCRFKQADGTDITDPPSLNGSAGGIEQCALYNVVQGLPEGAINLGVMVYNDNNIRDYQNQNCASSNGGCLVYPITPMTGDAKNRFLEWVRSWRTTGSAGSGYIKASGEQTGAVMQEAWAYFAGRTGLSGRTYIQPAAGCQKNYLIFVGNAFHASGTPADGGNVSVANALAAASGVSVSAQVIMGSDELDGAYGPDNGSFSCGTYTLGNGHTDSSGMYADEWARFMRTTDIYASLEDQQGIRTYGIGVLGASCKPQYPALLTSMAKWGGGDYYATTTYAELKDAFSRIFNELQAVNSVFSSASLPVSVNAQGTYLNQIFLGMFRPDGNASPRWLGNLKQYQFILEHKDPNNPDPNTATLRLGDATGQPALSSAGTGFLAPNAVSFWTSKDTSTAPDSTGGFFTAGIDPRYPEKAFDRPDGEVVEKGGAAQVLRKRNLTVDYIATPAGPRKLYTYCPSGTGCEPALTHTSNAFATTNAGITSAALNPTVVYSVVSMIKVSVTGGYGNAALVTTSRPHGLTTGNTVIIAGASETLLNGSKTVTTSTTLPTPDTQFIFPWPYSNNSGVTAGTGTITAQANGVGSRDDLINWVRGQDNLGDEMSPGHGYNIRPSVHGDVVHSRPVVVNYGDSRRGMVVFYGANDGVFRAVNGHQTASIGTGTEAVPPGGELWGLVLPEHFPKLNRQRTNTPEVRVPGTPVASAQPKDYFMDGSPGLYMALDANNAVSRAILYLNMRRGGNFIYAVDVTEPTLPRVLWRVRSSDAGFTELGQTWSRPRVTLVKGYNDPSNVDPVTREPKPKPVIVFGGGYDPAEDSEPPTADTMGRGIFVLDALTGERVWSAVYTSGAAACGSSNTCQVPGMRWAIPSDITFLDRDYDGRTDRLYATDLGGNIWRVDLEPTAGNAPANWQVHKLAALGCDGGVCASGTTPRKFFNPPSVISVGVTGASGAYDAVMIGSGDREHPLYSSTTGSAYNVTNRFYMIKDKVTGKDASGSTPLTEAQLFNAGNFTTAGSFTYTNTTASNGFYKTFATGEKAVNAPTTSRGTTFFGTNRPAPPSVSTLTCRTNLGEARGYAVSPFDGTFISAVYDGGGLPPSPIVGIVNMDPTPENQENGDSISKSFCIGCPGDGDQRSALGAGDLTVSVPKNLRRTFWYKK